MWSALFYTVPDFHDVVNPATNAVVLVHAYKTLQSKQLQFY